MHNIDWLNKRIMGKNWSGASAGPTKYEEENRTGFDTLRRNEDSITNRRYSDTTRPQRKRATKEYLEKRSGERNVDSRI